MTEQFKILDARSHCRTRPGMYVGSVSVEEMEQFLFGKWTKVQYVPALFKMINEVIDNSIDEFLRSNEKFATKIDISMDDHSVTVTDNGRGIPQDKVQTPEGELILRPVAAWTKNNAGTSFGESRTTIGSHGLGAALVNFMSSSFHGQTWSNGTCLHVVCSDGANEINTKTTKKSGHGTSVTFTPDFSLFECDSFDGQDLIDLVEDRLMGLQMAFPNVNFSFNGKRVQVRNIKQYAEMFAGHGASVIAEKSVNLTFFFTASDDGFRSNSFINGVNTRLGGTYVDHIVNNVADELLVLIKKKHKIEITKSVLKNGLTFVMFARDFVNPKYDSQTKERLTNSLSEVKSHFEGKNIKDFKSIAKKIFGADDIIEPIIAAQLEKKKAEDRRNAIKAQNKLKKVKVAKHIAANKSEEGTLFLMEGLCVQEDTSIFTLDGHKPLKDVKIGDFVFTHKNRFKKVISKSFALKDGFRLNGQVYSHGHRMFVYDKISGSFFFEEVSKLDKERHKLVRNRLIYHGIERGINEVRDIKKSNIVYTDKMVMQFSDTHEILFLNERMEVVSKTVKELKIGDIILL